MSRTDWTHDHPAVLLYDRFGCGKSDQDPNADDNGSHDISDAVSDLRQLIDQFCATYLNKNCADITVLFAAASIGGFISRLYTDMYPRSVCAILFLDAAPIIKESSIPDPTSGDFSAASLPEGITQEMCLSAREQWHRSKYHHSCRNSEGLQWSSLLKLLPSSGAPRLKHPDGMGPYITILVHDIDVYTKQSLKVSLAGKLSICPVNHDFD